MCIKAKSPQSLRSPFIAGQTVTVNNGDGYESGGVTYLEDGRLYVVERVIRGLNPDEDTLEVRLKYQGEDDTETTRHLKRTTWRHSRFSLQTVQPAAPVAPVVAPPKEVIRIAGYLSREFGSIAEAQEWYSKNGVSKHAVVFKEVGVFTTNVEFKEKQ